MKFKFAIVSTSVMLLVGCNGATPGTGTPSPVPNSKLTPTAKTSEPAAAAPGTTASADKKPAGTAEGGRGSTAPATNDPAPTSRKPVAVKDGVAELSPENSRIQFIGTHVGEKPEPRLGGFEKFSGKLSADAGVLSAVSFEIVTDSMWTEIGAKLTSHLKSPDFFDTKEFPEIKFQSTQIEPTDGGKVTITGDLTLHGVTKPVLVPAMVTFSDDGVILAAEFTIDRTEFGINYEPGKVDKTVALTVVIGEKTQLTK